MVHAPCGSWSSPLTPEAMARASVRIGNPTVGADGSVWWVEGRPHEGGRAVLVRRHPDGRVEDAVSAPYDVRSRVHEYGGMAYAIGPDCAWFVDNAEQRLYERRDDGSIRTLTRTRNWRLAEPVEDPAHARILAVGEWHEAGGKEAENAIVAIPRQGGTVEPIVRGADFYAAPTPSPDGKRLAWLQWRHPAMPWDAAETWVADVGTDGRVGAPRHVAGDANASTLQPGFAPDGTLFFVWEPEGFWNLYREGPSTITGPGPSGPTRVARMDGELGLPLWSLGTRTWGFVDAHHVVALRQTGGISSLVRIDVRDGSSCELPAPSKALGHLSTAAGAIATLVGWSDRGLAIELLDADGRALAHVADAGAGLPEGFAPRAEPVMFPTSDGDDAHGIFYAPCNPGFAPMTGEKPPLVVTVHGGPTGSALPIPTPAIAFWTSRGFAVLDVNYRGSTGFGRAYRNRLREQWGVYDVDDCVAGTRMLVDAGKVDPQRLAIRGGSAGGYTVLAALAFRDIFTAGASYYGVSDIEALVRDTHKFESRYNVFLLGPYPERAEVYRARSPVHVPERLGCPVIFFQGLEDKAVPPNQAEAMVAALRQRGIATEYHAFAGEGHGFRNAKNIRTAWAKELAFYGRVFGFAPA